MSYNISELTTLIRLNADMRLWPAADALEAQAKEIERLQSLVVETSAKAGAAIGSCEVLADAIARKAAERDRLKAALLAVRQYVRGGPDHVSDDDITAVFRISNDALMEALGDAS